MAGWQKGSRCEAGYLRVGPRGLCGRSGNNCAERCAFHYLGPCEERVSALRADSERADRTCSGGVLVRDKRSPRMGAKPMTSPGRLGTVGP